MSKNIIDQVTRTKKGSKLEKVKKTWLQKSSTTLKKKVKIQEEEKSV